MRRNPTSEGWATTGIQHALSKKKTIFGHPNGSHCKMALKHVSHPYPKFIFDNKRILIRNFSVDEAKKSPYSHLHEMVSSISFITIQLPEIRTDPKCTIQSGEITTFQASSMTYTRLSHNVLVAPRTVTSTALSKNYNCSMPLAHSNSSPWTFAAHCQNHHRHKATNSSLSWPIKI